MSHKIKIPKLTITKYRKWIRINGFVHLLNNINREFTISRHVNKREGEEEEKQLKFFFLPEGSRSIFQNKNRQFNRDMPSCLAYKGFICIYLGVSSIGPQDKEWKMW